jgi:glycosyltransferase involved in cell wall biosynthesis
VQKIDRAMPEPVKILHIAETIKGGIASYLNQVVPELNLREINGQFPTQRLLVPESDTQYLDCVPPEQVAGFKRNGRGPVELTRFAMAVRHEIAAIKPDILFLHSTFAGVIVRAQSRSFEFAPKVVYCAHGWAFEASRAAILNRLVINVEKRLSARTDRIITLSDGETANCAKLGFPTSRLVRVYNGISTIPPFANPASWQDSRLKVLFVGRFDRQKGIDTLLQAAAFAPHLVSVRCAGDAVVSRAGLRNIPDNVEILGWLSPEQLQAQLLAADIVAMPSRWEGLGISALEAMRASKPLVASDIGGLREVVQHGVTGWLVPREQPAALLAALLAPSAAERKAAGDAGRKRFERMFSLQQCVDGVHSVLAELAADRQLATTSNPVGLP